MLPPLPDPAGAPCPRCLEARRVGDVRREAVMPLGERPALADDNRTHWCHDCDLAWTLVRLRWVPAWDMARTTVQNDRQEQLRLPGTPLGLVAMGLMRPSGPDALAKHHAWLAGVFPEEAE